MYSEFIFYSHVQGYGMNVALLFLTGFTSSAIASVFVGGYIDTLGRKKACMLFCVLEVVIQALEHIPHMGPLLLGRVLGGISTALLFTAFEAWMVTEHKKRGGWGGIDTLVSCTLNFVIFLF